MTARDLITVQCAVTRASTCMGDDATAPHRRDYAITVAPDDAAPVQACLKTIALDYNYVPSVIGGSSWIARVDGIPVAIVVRRADGTTGEMRFLDIAPLPDRAPAALAIHFDYYLNVDPDRLAAQIEAGERPDRIYTPDASWMA